MESLYRFSTATLCLLLIWSVTDVNAQSDPEFISTPLTEVERNVSYEYVIYTNDADGEAVTITAPMKPAWLSLTTESNYVISTFAGSAGMSGSTDVPALFNNPQGVVIDEDGNIYVADAFSNKVRLILPDGTVSTYAGAGNFGDTNGAGATARFRGPADVVIDVDGNVYVADFFNHRIRLIDPDQVVSTYAGVSGFNAPGSTDGDALSEAEFNMPTGLAIDASGNIYVADAGNHRIRKIDTDGNVTTLAGSTQGETDDIGTAAQFDTPSGVAVDASGNVWVADKGNNTIRMVTPAGNVTTVIGDGTAATTDDVGLSAQFNAPHGIEIDAYGNLYVSETSGHVIRRITPGLDVTTIAGDGSANSGDGNGTAAQFSSPKGITVDALGVAYIADEANHTIRKITPPNATLSGTSPSSLGTESVQLQANDGNGGITTQDFDIAVTDLTPPVFSSGTTASFPENSTDDVYTAEATDADNEPTVFSLGSGNDESFFDITTAGVLTFNTPPDFEIPEDADTDNDYIVEVVATDNVGNSGSQLVTVSVTNQNDPPVFTSNPIITVKDNETYTYEPTALDLEFDDVNITATTLPSWLTLTPQATAVTTSTIAGTGSAGYVDGDALTEAEFNTMEGLTTDDAGNIYLAEEGNSVIRKITPDGVVSTYAGANVANFVDGPAATARFRQPRDVAFDSQGNLFVADAGNNKIRKISPDGTVSTFAGISSDGSPGNTDGDALTEAEFDRPYRLVFDDEDNLFISDFGNNSIRKITPEGVVSTFASGLNRPIGIDIDSDGNLYVAEFQDNVISRITPEGVVSEYASGFNNPIGVAVDALGNVFVGGNADHLIHWITPGGAKITFAGDGNTGSDNGPALSSTFHRPGGVTLDNSGKLFISDAQNRLLRRVSPPYATISGSAVGQVGQHTISLLATDANDGTGTQEFILTVIDATPPVVTNVTATNADGTYIVDEVISIQVTLNEVVTVTGTPQLALETGSTDRSATYTSGSGTSTLTFTYTVQEGDNSTDLDYTGTDALSVTEASIKDGGGNDATLTLAAPGASGSLGNSKDIVIDGVLPTTSTLPDSPDEDGDLSGNTDPGNTVELFVDGVSVGEVTADENGDYVFDIDALDLDPGEYEVTIEITDSSGNVVTQTVTFTVEAETTTGLSDLLENGELRMYPNPVSSYFTIDFTDMAPQTMKVSLLDLSGELLQEFNQTTTTAIQMDVRSYNRGLYVLRLVTSEGSITRKILITK